MACWVKCLCIKRLWYRRSARPRGLLVRCTMLIAVLSTGQYVNHRLNMEFIWAPCAQLYSIAEAPTPAFGLIYEGALGQPR
jgi:hypothetical protein